MPALPRLRVWLLGGFRVELDGRSIPDAAWRRNRARAVVKLLALTPGYRLHREQLMDALWPDLDARSAGANLRKAVYFARQALGSGVLSVRAESAALEARVEVDVDEFTAALDEGRRIDAIARYAGELLPEDRFESWADEPREQLRSRFVRALAEVAEEQAAAGDTGAAIATLSRLVAVDPLDEGAQRQLMALHARVGDRHLAIRQFRQLERALREELAVEPTAASRALFESIAAGGAGLASAAAPGGQGRAFATGAKTVPGSPAPEPSASRKLITVVAIEAAGSDHADVARMLEGWGATTERDEQTVTGIFGLPLIAEDDAERAVRAAMELAGAGVGRRVGIASGEVVVRATDGGASAGGQVALVARRLLEGARPGIPLALARTARAAGRRVQAGLAIPLPGTEPTIAAVPIHGFATSDAGPVVEAPLIGREAELASILRFADEVRDRRSARLLVVSGPAGVGKSRLVREMTTALTAGAAPTRVLRGRSLAGGRGATYWALGELLRDACGISLTESRETMERHLRATTERVLAALPAEDRAATVAALAASAGIRIPASPLDQQKPEEVSRALGIAWPRFAAGLADETPTVLVLEDLHWASPELVEMVELIVARSAGPLLVLVTARPELRDLEPGFGSSVDATTIALGPLSDRESGELVGHLLGESTIEPDQRARVLDRAEGNPLFLEQLASHLRDVGSEGLPDTLQSLLGARLDSLAPADRRVIQEAAVVGRAFWTEPLESALPGERIAARLALLERKRFIVRRAVSTLPGHDEYAFRHALLHDVAYRSLPRSSRARAHARAGTWLEAIAGSRVDEVSDLLAHHFESALEVVPAGAGPAPAPDRSQPELRAKAIDYLVRAGEGARRRFALARALDLHNRALRIAGSDRDRIRVLEAIAEDHDAGFHGDAAAAAYRQALGIARRPPVDRPAIARLARKLAWLMTWNPGAFRSSPDPSEAEGLVVEGLSARPDELARGWLLLARGAVSRLYRGSEPFGQGLRADPRPLRERIADIDEAVAIAHAAGDEDLLLTARHARGMLYGFEGRYGEMLELARIEVERLPDDASNLDRSDALRRLAVNLVNIEAGFEAAIDLGRQSRLLAGDTNPHQLLHTLWPIMAGLFQLGRWDEVAALVGEGAAAFRLEPAIECQFVRDGPVIGAAALMLLGRTNEARALAELPGDPMADRSSASAWQARYATISGRPEVARDISVDKALERRTYGPQHAFAYLEALEALGDWAAVDAFLPSAKTAVTGNAALRPLLDRAAGRARAAAGDPSTARRLLRRSVAGFRRLGMQPDADRAAEALDDLGAGAPPGTSQARSIRRIVASSSK